MAIRVLTVYHAGRDRQHRDRERALRSEGAELALLVPDAWPEPAAEQTLSDESFPIIELAVRRPGDVNRHSYADGRRLRELIAEVRPDVLDIREEPFSLATRQLLAAADPATPVVMYTAQNIDKRLPPPFSGYERRALRRAAGLYPCSRQAAAVARGKGFAGTVSVLPLGYDDTLFHAGAQTLASEEITLLLAGRLVREKGIATAVRVLQRVHAVRPARLVLVGQGPLADSARQLARTLDVASQLELRPWLQGAELAALYRSAHVVLVPSRATHTWAEQFGRVITEAQASGAVVAGYASGAIAEVAGEAGIIVAPGDFERLAQRVSDVVSDAEEFERRREAGRLSAARQTWHQVARTQLELYEAVSGPGVARRQLPRSPRARRALAREEFGATAAAAGGMRPFALPVLRNSGSPARALAVTIDAVAELAARLHR